MMSNLVFALFASAIVCLCWFASLSLRKRLVPAKKRIRECHAMMLRLSGEDARSARRWKAKDWNQFWRRFDRQRYPEWVTRRTEYVRTYQRKCRNAQRIIFLVAVFVAQMAFLTQVLFPSVSSWVFTDLPLLCACISGLLAATLMMFLTFVEASSDGYMKRWRAQTQALPPEEEGTNILDHQMKVGQ